MSSGFGMPGASPLSISSPLGGAGPLSITSPLGGATPFGFSVPQGNPGAIDGAARAARSLAEAMRAQGASLRAGAGVALEADGGWRGSAASAYAEYSGHVVGVIGTDAAGCELAAGALATLSEALAHAQSVTRQALADCERYQHEAVTQQGIAQQSGVEATTAAAQAAAAVHPAQQTALYHQASQASGRQAAAQSAAQTAQGLFAAARTKGIQAYEAFQETSRAVVGRLESAVSEMRQAPQIAGGPAVPITVSQSDVTMASTMLGSAGLAGAAAALSNPRELNGLACDNPITPGTALEFLQGFRNDQQLAQIAAADKPLDGSVGGVIPGPVGQFVQGAWDTTKAAGEFVVHPGEWVAAATTLLGANPAFRQLAYGENPVTAQSRATQTADGILKASVDYRDWASGNYAKALGALWPLDLKAVSELRAGWEVAAARPAVTSITTNVAANAFKVPYASEAGQVVGPFTRYTPGELKLMGQAQAGIAADSVRTQIAAARGEIAVVGATAAIRSGSNSAAVLAGMRELPVNPKIIVVPNSGARLVLHSSSGIDYRVIVPGTHHGG